MGDIGEKRWRGVNRTVCPLLALPQAAGVWVPAGQALSGSAVTGQCGTEVLLFST